VTQRDLIVTAKEVACLDRLCGGRFVLGVRPFVDPPSA
jgi:alkanesulfonate monooxygenase SsuD/methylene tetrahydromethanopterin reductase-like flavin-dependent oxidoreductase (luciferase family)